MKRSTANQERWFKIREELSGRRSGLLMALSFLLGLGLGCAQPIIMSLLYEASPPGRQGEAVGLRTSPASPAIKKPIATS